jgi:hypothetical protein
VLGFAPAAGRVAAGGSPRCCGEGLEGALVALLAPFRDQGGVQPFASEERAFAVTISPLVFGQNPQLVLGAIGPPGRSFGDLGLRLLSHSISMPVA